MSASIIKVMIVDDENLVREHLKRCINWEELGMQIAAEASGALEALELVEEIRPDFMFIDICMPFMDGIELSKLLFEKYPQIKIVILTGHEKFEFAKRSIKAGINDFILKPVNAEEIREVSLKIRKKIEEEWSYKDEFDSIKKRLEENLPILRDKFLNELVLSRMNYTEIDRKLQFFGISFENGFVQVVVIEIESMYSVNELFEENRLLLGMKGMDFVKKPLRRSKQTDYFLRQQR